MCFTINDTLSPILSVVNNISPLTYCRIKKLNYPALLPVEDTILRYLSGMRPVFPASEPSHQSTDRRLNRVITSPFLNVSSRRVLPMKSNCATAVWPSISGNDGRFSPGSVHTTINKQLLSLQLLVFAAMATPCHYWVIVINGDGVCGW